jgi:hypothetical protein
LRDSFEQPAFRSKWKVDKTPREALLETPDAKLREWNQETASQVRERVTEIIALADEDVLDLVRSCGREQEVLGILD